MIYEAVIFDLDGTLLDTIEDLADSMNTVLSDLDFPVHDTGSYRYFVGTGIRELVRKALPGNYRRDDVINKCIAAMLKEYENRWNNKTKAYKGIPEMLDRLADLGIRMSILSNKPHEFTLKVVKELLPDWKFEYIFGGREGVPNKPDPSSALEIAQLMNIPVEKFLYMGDSGTDMETAKAAGMYSVGVKWGFRKPEELISHGAKKIIGNPRELIGIFEDC